MNSSLLSGRILFGGYYGMDNVGDNCFGSVLTWGARHYWGSREVLLLSRKEVTGPVRTRPACSATPLFRGQFLLESYWQILRSSCVIWGGGSIFNSGAPRYTPKHLSFAAARLGVTAAGAIGVSLGPYRTPADRERVRSYLRSLTFLTLRDRPSFEEACRLALPYRPVLAADLAMLLPRMFPEVPSTAREHDLLGVTVCHYERYGNRGGENESRRERTLFEGLAALLRDGFTGTFRFFIFNAHPRTGDTEITMEFHDRLKEMGAAVELVPYQTDPIAVWRKVAQCSAMISTRLHGAIYAAAADVPCCLVEYHKKCSDFLSDAGVGARWVIGDAECSGGELGKKLGELLDLPRERFYPERDRLIALAERNFTFADEAAEGAQG